MFIEIDNIECDLIYNPFTQSKFMWSAILIEKYCPVLTLDLDHDLDNFNQDIVIWLNVCRFCVFQYTVDYFIIAMANHVERTKDVSLSNNGKTIASGVTEYVSNVDQWKSV